MTETGRTSRPARHRAIRSLVREHQIRTQNELASELERLGYGVTQATVSRDVKDLGLRKERDTAGRFRYVLPDQDPDPETSCARMLGEFAHAIVAAENLVLVKSDPGSAPGVGKVLDDLDHPLMLGCVAGDDTVLIVAPDKDGALAFARYLQELGG